MKRHSILLHGLAAITAFIAIGAFAPAQTSIFAERTRFVGAAEHDRLGSSVAVSDDIVVIGVPGHETTAVGAGAVYVMRRSNRGWTDLDLLGVLTASDGAISDGLGAQVQIEGDTIVASAPRKAVVYVFEKPSTGWQSMTETARLTETGLSVTDNFGESLAFQGDTIVVGAPDASTTASRSGAAFVFVRTTSTWTSMTATAVLAGADQARRDRFGAAVAMDGNTIVVGAEVATGTVDNAGAAYVFAKPTTGWSSQVSSIKLTRSAGAANDYFGSAVCVQDDLILVTAPTADVRALRDGALYVFQRPTAGWTSATESATLTPSDAQNAYEFGDTCTIHRGVIVVGASLADGRQPTTGAVYLFREPAGGWQDMTETEKLTASDGIAGDGLGRAIAIDHDTLFVGTPLANVTETNNGAVYVRSATTLTRNGSETIGGSATFNLHAPFASGQSYYMATSLGTTPHTIGGRQIGLSQDTVWFVSFAGLSPSVFANYSGTVDASGAATATLNIPQIPALVGVTVFTAGITLDPQWQDGVFGITDTDKLRITD